MTDSRVTPQAPLRDRVACRLAIAVLRLGTPKYRERLATLLERGMSYRAPAPKISERWRNPS